MPGARRARMPGARAMSDSGRPVEIPAEGPRVRIGSYVVEDAPAEVRGGEGSRNRVIRPEQAESVDGGSGSRSRG